MSDDATERLQPILEAIKGNHVVSVCLLVNSDWCVNALESHLLVTLNPCEMVQLAEEIRGLAMQSVTYDPEPGTIGALAAGTRFSYAGSVYVRQEGRVDRCGQVLCLDSEGERIMLNAWKDNYEVLE